MGSAKLKKNETIESISENLNSSKSEIRRKAAIRIRELNLVELGDNLYNAYLKEKEDKRTWETQMQMIQALGAIGYKKALSEINTIIDKNERLDMITFAAALSYVRLMKKRFNDISPIINLMKKGQLSILCGAMAALAFDDMIPEDEEIAEIINTIDGFDENRIHETGVHDPRKYLISAMSLWKIELTQPFLNKYVDTKFLKTNVEETLKRGKSCFE
jgi:hypothetical protein